MTLLAKITTRIELTDNVELVRDQIGAILLVESAKQQELARVDGDDPDDYKLRVFLERSDPWEVFRGPTPESDTQLDTTPLVNIRWEESKDDPSASNNIERQKVEGTYFLDCYGYGISTATADGHQPGDERAALAAQRAAGLVRKILMAGHYTYLDLQGIVSRRWRNGAKAFDPPMIDQRPAQHVQGVRVSFRVDFNELSPQVQGVPLKLIAVTATTTLASGEMILFEASYPVGAP